jgi:putative cell wall-binding protein
MDYLINKLKQFYARMIHYKVRFEHKISTKHCKIEVILTYWDKIYGQIQLIATKKKDKRANALYNAICAIKPEVKHALLKAFVMQY